MIFVKLSIVLWFLFVIARFFVKSCMTKEEKMILAVTGKMKMTFGRYIMVILFFSAIVNLFAALVWFLFFR